MNINPYSKYLGKEDILQNQVMRYIGLKYPKALFTHVANEGKRTKFEQYKLKYLGTKPGIPDIMIFNPKKMRIGWLFGAIIWMNVLKLLINTLTMAKNRTKKIYFHESTQKVRWTQTSSDDFKYDYKYIGQANEPEFDLLMDFLWFLYQDEEITFNQFFDTFMELRTFCDQVKGLIDKE